MIYFERMTEEKYHQRGFFIAGGDTKLTTHAEKGSEMIKPKVKKEPKSKKLTPYKEVMRFYGVLRKRANILEENGVYEDLNGIVHIQKNGSWSATSMEESTGILKKIEGLQPELPEIPVLSPPAQRLKYLLEHDDRRKPFITDHLKPEKPRDFLGKPLK